VSIPQHLVRKFLGNAYDRGAADSPFGPKSG
jgi:hypothetical protein